MQSKTTTGLIAEYETSGSYLEGTVIDSGIPKRTLWTHEGMNLEEPKWDLLSYTEKEKKLRDALTHKNTDSE